jgi:polar amino acid transport system substrate-binding protein
MSRSRLHAPRSAPRPAARPTTPLVSRPVTRRTGSALAAAAALVALAACAPAASSTGTSTASAGASSGASGASAAASGTATCAKDQLTLHTPGKLTIGTDNPVYEPWFSDNKPANGKGFESAVAYAVAGKLGFTRPEVVWTTASFNSAIAPGPKTYDFDVNEISITPERRKAVDFSSGYYDVTQAIVTVKGSKVEKAKTIAELKAAKLGAQVGTTSYKTITDVIAPSQKPAVFNTNDDAKLALTNGQIDGLVLDLPTALFEANADLKNGVLVGQFENSAGTPEQFGLALDLGSPLTTCVSQAVDALRADGTLKKLEQQWLTASAGAPVLK